MLLLGTDNAGKSTLVEQIKKIEGLSKKQVKKLPPTIGLNIAKITKYQGEFVFWDVGGQASLRKLWQKYITEANGVVFVIDGSDESRFDEVREVIDGLWTRRGLDDAGLPVVKGSGDIEDESLESTLADLPCLFLLNKNDSPDFKGIETIQRKLELSNINCIESVCLPVSALDANGVDAALSWIYRSVYENSLWF